MYAVPFFFRSQVYWMVDYYCYSARLIAEAGRVTQFVRVCLWQFPFSWSWGMRPSQHSCSSYSSDGPQLCTTTRSWPQIGFLTLPPGDNGFCFYSSLSSMFLGKFSAPYAMVDSLCSLLSTRPMVGTGEVSCPSLRCSFYYRPSPSSKHLLHLSFPQR